MSYFSASYYFDESYYLRCKLALLAHEGGRAPDGQAWTESSLRRAIQDAGLTPQSHYETHGRYEGLNPNLYFNETEYLNAKLGQLHSIDERDATGKVYTLQSLKTALDAAGMTTAEHYERYGAFETNAQGRYINPSNAFDANSYYATKLLQCQENGETVGGHTGNAITLNDLIPAFMQAGLSPINHYLSYGSLEAYIAGMAFARNVSLDQRTAADPGREITCAIPDGFERIHVSMDGKNVTVTGEAHGAVLTLAANGTVSGMVKGEMADASVLSEYKLLDASAVTGGPLILDTQNVAHKHDVTGSATAVTTFLLSQTFLNAKGGTGANTFIVHADTLSDADAITGNYRTIQLGGGAKDRISLAEGGIKSSFISGIRGTDGADTIEITGSSRYGLGMHGLSLGDGDDYCSLGPMVHVDYLFRL